MPYFPLFSHSYQKCCYMCAATFHRNFQRHQKRWAIFSVFLLVLIFNICLANGNVNKWKHIYFQAWLVRIMCILCALVIYYFIFCIGKKTHFGLPFLGVWCAWNVSHFRIKFMSCNKLSSPLNSEHRFHTNHFKICQPKRCHLIFRTLN